MTKLPLDIQHRVAHRVASAWRRRGVWSYSYEDLYQDAVEIMHSSLRNYKPEKGVLEAYLSRCCVHKLGDRLTRAIQPASAKSNDEVVHLRNLKAVRHNPHATVDPLDYDHLVWLTQVRQRMLTIVEERGKLPLRIALGLTDVADVARNRAEAQHLHQEVRRIKRRLLNDRRLYNMLKEVQCRK